MHSLILLFLASVSLIYSQEQQADGWIVDYRDHLSWDTIEEYERSLGIDLQPLSEFSSDEKLAVLRGGGDTKTEALRRLGASELVEVLEPNYIYRLPKDFLPQNSQKLSRDPNPKDYNDPFYKHQWHMAQIRVAEAHKTSQGKGIVVAVIDTGVAYADFGRFRKARDLNQTEFVKPFNFIANNSNAHDDHGHGTHVAGTIAQSTNNGLGVIGVAPQSIIMPLKVLSASGGGDVASIARAIRYAADEGAKVINLSLGGPMPATTLQKALRYARSRGVLPVCAAGNSGGSVGYPAAFAECMAVSAVQYDETVTFYSSRGPEVDIAAPGGNVRVDQNGDGIPDGVLQNTIYADAVDKDDYLLFMGTSMAAPHVAGVAALVAAKGVQSPDKIEKILLASARPKGDPKLYGAGIVDASKALNQIKSQDSLNLVAAALTLGVSGMGLAVLMTPQFWLGALVFASGFFGYLGGILALVAAVFLWHRRELYTFSKGILAGSLYYALSGLALNYMSGGLAIWWLIQAGVLLMFLRGFFRN